MPLAKIKTEEERARLDAIFAEIEAAERGELFEPEPQQDPQKSAKERYEKDPLYRASCIAGLALGRLRTQINETVDPELKKKRMENAWKTRRGK